MQYHVPSEFLNPSLPSPVAASGNGGARPSNSATASSPAATGTLHDVAVPPHANTSGLTGFAVGQGLLSGRRLAVRVAPSNAVQSPLPFSRDAEPLNDNFTRPHAAGFSFSVAHNSASGGTLTGALTGTPSPCATSSPVPSSTGYGGGIVRISDLRRQGVQSVESGLRLTTLSGGRPAATLPAERAPVRRAADDANTPLADAYASVAGRGGGGGRSSASSTTTRGRGRGGRTSTGSRRSARGSAEVTLTETGELCEHRWFMARGRRCFVYDGRTYKGSSAHTMWKKVKEIASRQQRQNQRSLVASRSVVKSTTTTTSRNEARIATTRTGAAVTPRSQPHRTSARALSASHRSLHLENALSGGEGVGVEASTISGAAPLRDEWQDLMRQMGITHEEGELNHRTAVASFPAPTRSARTPAPASIRLPPLPVTEPRVAADVVEITDSSEASSSETDDSSTSGRASSSKDSTAQDPPTLRWPTTSYFSDESSGWSSTSSPVAPRSPVEHTQLPALKKMKTERSAVPQHPQQPSAPPSARVQMYNGVEVVEEDGWLYPVEVYASQQKKKQQQRGEQGSVSGSHGGEGSVVSSPHTLVAPQAETLSSDVLPDIRDVPLSDLYPPREPLRAPPLNQTRGAAAAHNAAVLMRGVDPEPPSSHPPAGISVIRGGTDSAVPLRPATALRGNASAYLGSWNERAHLPVLRGVGDDADLLEGFSNTDLAGMFVTGEEIGGVRYEA